MDALLASAAAEIETDGNGYYTVPEVARLLRVSPSIVWRWIEAGKLPAYRVGGKTIRIKKIDLEAFFTPVKSEKRGGLIAKGGEDITSP